jgi:hypothetical protein
VLTLWHSAKSFFAECPKKNSAKSLALGKDLFSGSEIKTGLKRLNDTRLKMLGLGCEEITGAAS